MDFFSEFATEDGLDSDGERILEMGSQQEVETGAVVQIEWLYAEKEYIHTPTSCQVQPEQTRSLRDPPVRKACQKNNNSMPRASEKYLMDLFNSWVPEKTYIDNTG